MHHSNHTSIFFQSTHRLTFLFCRFYTNLTFHDCCCSLILNYLCTVISVYSCVFVPPLDKFTFNRLIVFPVFIKPHRRVITKTRQPEVCFLTFAQKHKQASLNIKQLELFFFTRFSSHHCRSSSHFYHAKCEIPDSFSVLILRKRHKW